MTQDSPQQLQLEPIEQNTLTKLVSVKLITQISKGILRPGDRLPPERDLAKQLNVGRTTIREALKLLTLGGLLEAKRGDGTYVRTEFDSFFSQYVEWPILLSVEKVDQFFEVREALEVKSARLAAERATSEELEKIDVFRKLLDLPGRDVEKETDLDMEFHYAIATASHNILIARLMKSMNIILRQYIELSNKMTDRNESTFTEHEAIYDAICAHSPDLAEQRMVDHLAISRRWIQSKNNNLVNT